MSFADVDADVEPPAFFQDRLVILGKEDMLVLLQNAEVDRCTLHSTVVALQPLIHPPRPPEVANFSPPAQALLGALDTGSVAYLYRDLATGLAIELVGWLGDRHSNLQQL